MFKPEHDVGGSEGYAIRPLRTLTQVDGDGGAVFADFPTLGNIGHDFGEIFGIPEEQAVAASDAMAILSVARAGEAATPGATIFADFMDWLNDEEFFTGWQAFFQWGKITGCDQFGQHWGFGEFGGEFIDVGDDDWAFDLTDQGGAKSPSSSEALLLAGASSSAVLRRLPLLRQALRWLQPRQPVLRRQELLLRVQGYLHRHKRLGIAPGRS